MPANIPRGSSCRNINPVFDSDPSFIESMKLFNLFIPSLYAAFFTYSGSFLPDHYLIRLISKALPKKSPLEAGSSEFDDQAKPIKRHNLLLKPTILWQPSDELSLAGLQ